ncbi:MAG: hypothetical protein JSS32_02350 [Verrucomicrobia bacterium]|nr:hypothetical protein [Verrucomicrobiota bacterium]
MIRTNDYVSNLNLNQFGRQFSQTFLNRYCKFIHSHPTTAKVIQIAAIALGAALLVASFFLSPAIGIGLGILGAVTLLTGALTFKYGHFLTVPHDMKRHAFKEGGMNGCSLRYCNDVPIFTIENDDPMKVGEAHGFLLAPQIQAIRQKFNKALHGIARRPVPEEIATVIDEVSKRIPDPYMQELKGLVIGFNRWAGNDHSIPLLTDKEMILFHLMPDSVHFKLMQEKEKPPAPAAAPAPVPVPVQAPASPIAPLVPAPLVPALAGSASALASQSSSNIACTAIAARDLLARNLDWPTMGIAGAGSIVTVRKQKMGEPIVEVGFAGFIGTLTGMKGSLRLAMNICDGNTDKVEGMPAAFLNRQCLETCSTVQEVQAHLENNRSLGPYHITAADKEGARAFHLLQIDGDVKPLVREYVDGENPLIVTNCRYTSTAGGEASHRSCSLERGAILNEFFQDAKAKTDDFDLGELAPVGLSLPFVDNWESAHRVIMKGDGSLEVSFDNGFAGSAPLCRLTREELVEEPLRA